MEAVAEVPYAASNDDELSFSVGDIITNVFEIDGIWLEGSYCGKRGRFRKEFVKLKSRDVSVVDGNAPPKKGDKKVVRVLYDYNSPVDDELELKVNDIVEVVEETEESWWKGILRGKVGMFPSNFVTLVTPGSPSLSMSKGNSTKSNEKKRHSMIIQSNTSCDKVSKRSSMHSYHEKGDLLETDFSVILREKKVTNQRNQSGTEEGNAPQLPPKPVREHAKALYPYAAQNEDELTLKEGDIITVISKEVEDKGWWRGELNGQIGVFPDNFVELIKAEEVAQKKPERPDKPVLSASTKAIVNRASQSEKKPFQDVPRKKNVPQVPPPPPSKPPPPLISKKDEKAEHLVPPYSKPLPVKKPVRLSPGSKTPCVSSHSPAINVNPAIETSPPPIHNLMLSSQTSLHTDSVNSIRSVDKSSETATDELNDAKDSSEFDLSLIETSSKKLVHLTANRAKVPNKRPPSHIFLKESEKENKIRENEMSSPENHSKAQSSSPKVQMKDFVPKEHITSKASVEEKPKVPPSRPAPPVSAKAYTPKGKTELTATAMQNVTSAIIPKMTSSAVDSTVNREKEVVPEVLKDHGALQTELHELRKEIGILKDSMVSRTEYNKLLSEVSHIKNQLEAEEDDFRKLVSNLKNSLEEEKKLRIAAQNELEKLKNAHARQT